MKKKIRIIAIVALLLIAGGSITALLVHNHRVEMARQKYDSIREVVRQEPQTPAVEEPAQPEVAPVEIPIDFAALHEINPEIYAWIQIPGTALDYPVAQRISEDPFDEFYLNRTVDGREGLPGSIFTQGVNSRDFTDFNTVFYGHNMRNGSMFSTVRSFQDAEFFKEHSEIIIYTPEQKFVYEVAAAVVYNDQHILENYDFEKPHERINFLLSLKSIRDMRSRFNEDIILEPSDQLITLSTCITGEDTRRFILVGRLVQVGNEPLVARNE